MNGLGPQALVWATLPRDLWTSQRKRATVPLWIARERGRMAEVKSEVFQGTLDLMVLKTLEVLGPLHGYGIARRIEQMSEQLLRLNEGTVYASLLRLSQKGWIRSAWGTSENNRKARFYSISAAGRRQLAREAENWERFSEVIGRILQMQAGG